MHYILLHDNNSCNGKWLPSWVMIWPIIIALFMKICTQVPICSDFSVFRLDNFWCKCQKILQRNFLCSLQNHVPEVLLPWIQSINRKDWNANQAQILLFVVLLTTVTPGLRYKANYNFKLPVLLFRLLRIYHILWLI